MEEMEMKVVFEPKDKMTKLSSGLNPRLEYTLISDKDQVLHNVHFIKDKPTIMTGILAKLCLESGGSSVRLVIPEEEEAKKEFEQSVDDLIEQKVQQRLKELEKQSADKIESKSKKGAK